MNPLRWLIQASAFLRKEITEVLHQPALVAMLVLGPFAVLLVFGLGYRDEAPHYSTVFVGADDSVLTQKVGAYADEISKFVDVVGTVDDVHVARRMLADGKVDLAVVLPDDPVGDVLDGKASRIVILHDRLDPVEQVAIGFAAQLAVDQMNAEVLTAVADQGQDLARPLKDTVRALDDLTHGTQRVRAAVGSGTGAGDLGELTDIRPEILVRPFAGDVEALHPTPARATDFYAPSALVLLVQHFGVSFGALTFVRERQLGIVELFQVSPLGAVQALVGKYLGYLLFGGLVSAALGALVVGVLDIPLQGEVGDLALVLAAVLTASVGLGFVLSLVARTDTEAVQYAMITLLASLFFSGFFLSVEQLSWPAQAVSWALPVTYGIRMLQDVMLRGDRPDPQLLAVLGGYGLAMFLVALVRVRARFATA